MNIPESVLEGKKDKIMISQEHKIHHFNTFLHVNINSYLNTIIQKHDTRIYETIFSFFTGKQM